MKTFLLILLYPVFAFDEEAPIAEYPYPSTKKVESGVEKPYKVGPNGTYYYKTKKKKKAPNPNVEQPYKIGEDGTYYYDTDKKRKRSEIQGIEKPDEKNDDGSYHYDTRIKKKRTPRREGVPYPTKILDNGTHIYSADEDEQKETTSALFIRGGLYGPPDVSAAGNAARGFEDVYSDKAGFIFNFDYEWKLFDFLGNFMFKIGSGLSMQTGDGQFSSDNQNANTNLEPREEYQFILFPNTVSISYKFNFSRYVIPYLEPGLGYYTFWERRTDGESNNFGGAPVISGAGGLLISLNAFSSGTSLSSDYSATDLWLDLQFRQVVGLDDRKDFTGSMITGGFGIGF